MSRGKEAEARVLKDMGLEKNTKSLTTAEGKTIPDAMTESKMVEIKDTKEVYMTKQLRIQTDAARESGRKSILVTGEKTKVSDRVEKAFDIIERRSDLGPQQ
jgi:propanediol dehydratase small subunit